MGIQVEEVICAACGTAVRESSKLERCPICGRAYELAPDARTQVAPERLSPA